MLHSSWNGIEVVKRKEGCCDCPVFILAAFYNKPAAYNQIKYLLATDYAEEAHTEWQERMAAAIQLISSKQHFLTSIKIRKAETNRAASMNCTCSCASSHMAARKDPHPQGSTEISHDVAHMQVQPESAHKQWQVCWQMWFVRVCVRVAFLNKSIANKLQTQKKQAAANNLCLWEHFFLS